MSKQWNPLNDLMSLQDRMNRLFEDATERRARVATETSDEIETAEWCPAADVYDQESEYLIAVDLPGVSRSAVEIDLHDDKLVIRGTRTLKGASSTGQRPEGRFLRTFTVPTNVNQQEIGAEYKNGVLEIRLQSARSKRPSEFRSR
ncbi:MAG: Hsp20/alpha crystallin family protein [Pyrinomonadaceae bacterium]